MKKLLAVLAISMISTVSLAEDQSVRAQILDNQIPLFKIPFPYI